MTRFWLILAWIFAAPFACAQSLTPDSAQATVHIVVFESFNCVYCAKSVVMLRELERKYKGSLAIQFRHFPSSRGVADWLPHEAVLAAAAQGRFTQMYDALFASAQHLSRHQIDSIAKSLNLDVPRFQKELDEHVWKSRIADDVQEARALGVKVTPTLFVDGFKLEGLQNAGVLTEILDRGVRSNSASNRSNKETP